MSRAGIVLCGGRSSRMGRAKARLPWFGQTMIEHVVTVLMEAVDEVVVVTSESLELPSVSSLGARLVTDREPERGPLAGIRDGLLALESDAEFAFVTSTDAPFLTQAYVSAMLDRERACAPLSEGFVQVLSGVYSRGGGAVADRLLGEGVGRPLRLLEALDYEQIEFSVDERPVAWHGFNTAEAYLDSVRGIEPDAKAEIEFVWGEGARTECPPREVPVGTLGEVLASCGDFSAWADEGLVPDSCRVEVGSGEILRQLSVPVGPRERVRVTDVPVEKLFDGVVDIRNGEVSN